MKVRRVVTAETARKGVRRLGRDCGTHDDSTAAGLGVLQGVVRRRASGVSDRKPRIRGRTYFPLSEGFRFMWVTFPPDTMRLPPDQIDVEQMSRELAEKLPNTEGTSDMDPEGYEGNHRTDTVDMGVVISGEVELRVDDDVVTLRQGDCIVQGGARHAWNNRTNEPCVVAFVIVGGERKR